jgi:serine/threonine-protein kinase RsbW
MQKEQEMQTEEPLRLALPAEPENVAVVRRAVAERGERIGLDQVGIDDLKTVVSEACGNVVRHAYPPSEAGSLEVEMNARGDAIELVVRDHGAGIRPGPIDPGGLRMGLLLIGALSSSFTLSSARGRGTEVTMRLAKPEAPPA